MSKIKFLKKTPAGPLGNFNYEYECTCNSGKKQKNITVTTANDNAAKQLAQLECDDKCGETAKKLPSLSATEERVRDIEEQLGRIAGKILRPAKPKRPSRRKRTKVTAANERHVPQTADGWLLVLNATGTAVSLPSALSVQLLSTTTGRDRFNVNEGIHINMNGSAVAGNLALPADRLTQLQIRFSPRAAGPIAVDGESYDREVTLSFRRANRPEIAGPFPAKTDPSNPIAAGSYPVEIADYPHPCDPSYGQYRTVWFRVGRTGDRYVHPGRVSAGCVTCAPRYWVTIYQILNNSRADASTVGVLNVI